MQARLLPDMTWAVTSPVTSLEISNRNLFLALGQMAVLSGELIIEAEGLRPPETDDELGKAKHIGDLKAGIDNSEDEIELSRAVSEYTYWRGQYQAECPEVLWDSKEPT